MTYYYQLLYQIQRKKNRQRIDSVMMVAAVLHPLMALPQVMQIYTTREAAGVSLLSWTFWLCNGIVFLLYGIAHKLKPYILMQIIWTIIDALVIIGILMYG